MLKLSRYYQRHTKIYVIDMEVMSGDVMMSVLRDALISCIVPASVRANHHLSGHNAGTISSPAG